MESLFIGYLVYNTINYFNHIMKKNVPVQTNKKEDICECTKIIFEKDSELYCEQFTCKKCCFNNCIHKYTSSQL